MLINLDQMPGDERTLIGFIGVDSALHFFQFIDYTAAPKQLVAFDVDGKKKSYLETCVRL